MKLLSRYKHKNSRLLYFSKGILKLLIPGRFYRNKLDSMLAGIAAQDASYVRDRVDYYNKIREPFELTESAVVPRLSLFSKGHNYYLDLCEYAKYFDPAFRVCFRFGDMTAVPETPTIVKARPIAAGNDNSVLFNLNKVRHFLFVNDERAYSTKLDRLVWRGRVNRPHRRRFVEAYSHHESCDVGPTDGAEDVAQFRRPFMSIDEQLGHKFILSIEGNDVATNLKWILSSNSLCFMVKPKFETWFMEGRLIPDVHYVLLRDDYSNLIEKMQHYSTDVAAAQRIIESANEYVAQFLDKDREDLISLLVLKRYFETSGQIAGARRRN